MKPLIPLFFIHLTGQLFAQTDTSIYKNLETRKFYSVSYSASTRDGQTTYEINGKKVNKATYEKYHSTWKNMETCCPCILQYYNVDEVILREAIACTDCGVGYFKTYYPNGQISSTGHYKENPTGNWDELWDRGYCSVKDGQWTYFSEEGDTLYSEFWKDNEFVQQIPEQVKNEIWKVELTLDGKPVENRKLTQKQVQQIVITPRFKNNASVDTNLIIKFKVSAVGYKENEKSFTPKTLKEINIKQILSEVGIPSKAKTTFSLTVYNGEEYIDSFNFNVKL